MSERLVLGGWHEIGFQMAVRTQTTLLRPSRFAYPTLSGRRFLGPLQGGKSRHLRPLAAASGRVLFLDLEYPSDLEEPRLTIR